MTLAQLLTDMGAVFTAVIGYFGDVIDMFVSQPILLLTFGITFASIVIGMARGFLGR
jgi:ABC-type microcin C transport system permease subunit YejE